MKAVKSLLMAFVLVGPVWAAKPADNPPAAVPETTVNAAAHYVDSVFCNTLAALELIAATPEARSGDWNGIKRYLKRIEADVPGVYFFVLPNGNYYSVALDYTNLNLSDRAYFKPLFAGNQVKGFPIYSRSSGKKSALMAAPIVVDNKVVGALGASVFLDDMHARLNRDLALPPGYTWFVVDATGNTMLHEDADFIFMNTLTKGSPSLREAVSTTPEKIYRAFLDADAMVKWLPPHGFTGKVHELDVRVGGAYRMSFTNFSTGKSHSFGGKYVELVPNERIRHTDSFDDPNLPGEMLTTVTLKPVSCGTEFNVVQEGIPEAIPAEACYLGWQESLTLLAQLVEAEIKD